MTSLARFTPWAVGMALATLPSVFSAPAAKAFCTSTSDGNNCTTLNSRNPSTVTLEYKPANDPTDWAQACFFQLLPYVSQGTGTYTLTTLSWRRGPTGSSGNYTPIVPTFNVSNNAVATPNATNIIGTNPFDQDSIFFRYAIPAGVPAGTNFNFTFIANGDKKYRAFFSAPGSPCNNQLLLNTTNGSPIYGVIAARNNLVTAVSTPAPLPMLGAAVAMAHASRLGRRIRQQQLQ